MDGTASLIIDLVDLEKLVAEEVCHHFLPVIEAHGVQHRLSKVLAIVMKRLQRYQIGITLAQLLQPQILI